MKSTVLGMKTNNLLYWGVPTVILCVADVYLNYHYFNHGVYLLNGSFIPHQTLWQVIKSTFLGIPLLGFVLGTVVALIPYQKKKYGQKLFLSSIIGCFIVCLFGFLISIVLLTFYRY